MKYLSFEVVIGGEETLLSRFEELFLVLRIPTWNYVHVLVRCPS